MREDRSLSRRRFMALGGAAAASALAGCSSEPPQARTPTPSVYRGTSFEGTDLVVDLVEDHGVERLNLIGPDGQLFAQSAVAVGETRVGLEILNIRPGLGGYEHYSPGVHELVAVGSDIEETFPIELQPHLRAVGVRQYREGERRHRFAQILVDVENVGSGPTWVYSVKYQDSPNWSADEHLGGDPGILWLEYPEDPNEALIGSGETRRFVGLALPLSLSDEQSQECIGNYQMTVIVESPVLEPIKIPISVGFDGDPIPIGLGRLVCTDVSVTEGFD